MPYYIKKKKAPLFKKEGVKVKRKVNLKSKLDKIFSEYIRLRDSKQFGFKAFRCIACGQIKPYAQADNGHFWSRTHLATRFDEDNCHAECRSCNRFKADHLIGYEENLKKKIGEAKFEMLKIKHNNFCKMGDFEYTQLIKYYRAKIQLLKNGDI